MKSNKLICIRYTFKNFINNLYFFSITIDFFLIYGIIYGVNSYIRGCNGFDGDKESGAAGSVEFHFNRLNF